MKRLTLGIIVIGAAALILPYVRSSLAYQAGVKEGVCDYQEQIEIGSNGKIDLDEFCKNNK